MTLIPNEDKNNRDPLKMQDVVAGIGIAGLFWYVVCLITGII